MPDVIYEEVVEVDERVCLVQDNCKLGLDSPIVTGTTGEQVTILLMRGCVLYRIIVNWVLIHQLLLEPLENRSLYC